MSGAGESRHSVAPSKVRSEPHGEAGPLLSVSHLTKHYPMRRGVFGRGGDVVHAVDDVSFAVDPGS